MPIRLVNTLQVPTGRVPERAAQHEEGQREGGQGDAGDTDGHPAGVEADQESPPADRLCVHPSQTAPAKVSYCFSFNEKQWVPQKQFEPI